MTRQRRQTAGRDDRALPFSIRDARLRAWRGISVGFAVALLLTGCGAKPTPPTAPIRTHLEDAAAYLPRIVGTPWQRFTFNDWERLRARSGLGDMPVADWAVGTHSKEEAALQGWLVPPGSVAAAAALAPFGIDAASLRWQAALDGPENQPITHLVTAAAQDARPRQIGVTLAPLGYIPAGLPSAAQANEPVVYMRAAGGAGSIPALLDSDPAALIATPAALVTVHDPARLPDAVASASNVASLNDVPFFRGLIAGISDIEAMVIFRIGTDGYRDTTSPPLDAPSLPFDALGAALHITDAGAQYVTLAFHVRALPGGRLPEGMAEWWATRFGLDQPDPRAEYLEAFGNDGWLFVRYRLLSPDERRGGTPPGEIPFWQSVTAWQPIYQRWMNFTPRTADPIPRIGT